MSAKKTPVKEAKAVIDNYHEIHHPLDFSFKTLSTFSGILRERSRTRESQAVVSLRPRRSQSPKTTKSPLILDDELSAEGSTESVVVEQSRSMALRVNNNMLADWEDFLPTMCKLFVEPTTRLAWIDLSFNDLRTVDKALLELPALTMLYLHGNQIDEISEVDKLSKLPKLKSLTLHGNPIEIIPGYRYYVLSRVTRLQTFDFGGITKADKATTETWKTMIAPKPRTKKCKSEGE